ncbi:MAG: class I SAM-dependent methyltransferase [Planctomycetales bacterium]|nr:class I SAM-dependent methyltransferase [Planctomycetales bacterium]
MSAEDRKKWDAKYADAAASESRPSDVLQNVVDLLPEAGRALDIAGGAGRHSLWLAERGWQVTLADISPIGLHQAARRATDRGLSIDTLPIDFDNQPLPPGPWDLIVSVLFYCPAHWTRFASALAPGGVLLYLQPTRRNLERNDRPPFQFLLPDGELPSLIPGLEVLHYEEGWLADGRHDALLVARRSSDEATR